MKIISFSFLLFAVIISSNFACQQKKTTATTQLPNDSIPLSPVIMSPGVSDKTDKTKKTDTVPARTRIVIKQMEAQILDTGTQIGKPGDLLLTFTGQGFVFTDRNPVLMSGGLKFENTYSNEEGTEFYAVIPADKKERLAAAAGGGLQIINPGNESVTFKEQTTEVMKRADSDKKVKLIYTKFAVTRQIGEK